MKRYLGPPNIPKISTQGVFGYLWNCSTLDFILWKSQMLQPPPNSILLLSVQKIKQDRHVRLAQTVAGARKKIHSLRLQAKAPENAGVIIIPTQTMHYWGEITINDHQFALFHPPNIGNLMTPEIGRNQKEKACLPTIHFQVLCHVSFREGTLW